jgi:RNA polymerase sigma-70 factor (sigma-E family)
VIGTLVGDQRGRLVDAAARDADEALVALYTAHYRSLVRLSALLLRDAAAAEDVVQDAFVAMHGSWRRLRDTDKALAYLRQAVVNRSRSRLRHLKVAERKAPALLPADASASLPSAEHGAMAALEREHVIKALRSLPQRQREVIVLRYYGDLSEAQIAEAMGISTGAVKSHASRGIGALRDRLEHSS